MYVHRLHCMGKKEIYCAIRQQAHAKIIQLSFTTLHLEQRKPFSTSTLPLQVITPVRDVLMHITDEGMRMIVSIPQVVMGLLCYIFQFAFV